LDTFIFTKHYLKLHEIDLFDFGGTVSKFLKLLVESGDKFAQFE